jgi:hypothetical protein
MSKSTSHCPFEGSATLKSKVFGGKKAKEKRENVIGFFEEINRKVKVEKQTWVLLYKNKGEFWKKEKEKSKKGKKGKKLWKRVTFPRNAI